jgi:ferredoxin-NADP reductase
MEVEVRVAAVDLITDNVMQLTFESTTAERLPTWTPGSHIDVSVGDLGWRQYSLCSNSNNDCQWQIAVLLDSARGGGSHFLHTAAHKGDVVKIRGPWNRFPLETAKQYIFVAGGIAITAPKPMLEATKRSGTPYRLIYLGRSRKAMAFADQMESGHSGLLWPKDELGRYDLKQLIPPGQEREDVRIYCCGPERLIRAVEAECKSKGLPAKALRVEHFAPVTDVTWENKPFDAVLVRSGRRIKVPRDRSLLEVLNEHGTGLASTCARGKC